MLLIVAKLSKLPNYLVVTAGFHYQASSFGEAFGPKHTLMSVLGCSDQVALNMTKAEAVDNCLFPEVLLWFRI